MPELQQHPIMEHTIKQMAKLPGMGNRSARRALLHLLMNKDKDLHNLINYLRQCYDAVQFCQQCGALNFQDSCDYCHNPNRDARILCVVENMSDLWAIERSQTYNGLYHILGGVLSALDGVGPDNLNFKKLWHRCDNPQIKEIILATNVTIDGQTTAYYIQDNLKDFKGKITRLAHGVPAGGELEFMDDGTINAAFHARNIL